MQFDSKSERNMI